MYCQIFPAVCRDTQVLFPGIHDVFSGTTFHDFRNFNYFSKIHALSSEGLSASVRYALWDMSNLECTRHWWYSAWCWKWNECSGIEFWKLYICYMLKLVQAFIVCYIQEEFNCRFLQLQQMLHSLLHLPDTLNPAVLS